MYFNTKKAKSRKRNLNSKHTYSDKKVKNLSNSDKKPNQKKFKPQGFFSSVLSETTPREFELSPQKRKLFVTKIATQVISVNNSRPRKNSQIVSIGSDARVYTPDQMVHIYDESA